MARAHIQSLINTLDGVSTEGIIPSGLVSALDKNLNTQPIEALRSGFSQLSAGTLVTIEVSPVDVEVSFDLVSQSGTYIEAIGKGLLESNVIKAITNGDIADENIAKYLRSIPQSVTDLVAAYSADSIGYKNLRLEEDGWHVDVTVNGATLNEYFVPSGDIESYDFYEVRYDANTDTFNFYVKPVMKEVEEDTTPTEETPAKEETTPVVIEENEQPLANNTNNSTNNNKPGVVINQEQSPLANGTNSNTSNQSTEETTVDKETTKDTTVNNTEEETTAAGVTIEEDKAPLASNGVQSSINNSNSTSSSLSVVTVAIVAFAVLIILLVAGVLARQAKKEKKIKKYIESIIVKNKYC